ncbi:phosphonoacetaldehyde hydrolase [Gemmata sp. JC717]|uniref:phosphonoacetaldehyde hydrolase n=1 Tax=Gemmata algarum TaxID=2975278 RepID=UPI0021BA8D19|nr:phosphonoacetaldehyde hydrolase [Gemmata algarum]MDY3553525.1 phosphonoacetaldehyde hydrolase [Gemmata algarum]
MAEIKLVVLDWAGTTIDFGCRAPSGAFVAAFATKGVAVTLPEARGPMGLHKKDHIRAMLRTEAVGGKWRAAAGRDWSEADVEELYCDVTPRQVEAAVTYSELIPGAREAVTAVRAAGIKVAATTGYFHEAAAAVAGAAKRQGYEPDFNICADDVPAGRPAPWMIFRCMEALGVYPPAAVLKVGDTVIDIEDGRNAGCWSVGVIDSSNEMGLSADELRALPPAELAARRGAITERYKQAGAHAAINDLGALPALIADLNAKLARGERP